MDRYMEIDWLKANHKMIHYFGLGFIQLKLNDTERMHFYSQDLLPITPDEDVHNHRYDFTSKILKGTLIQHLYEVVHGFTHVLEKESCKEGVAVADGGRECGLKASSSHVYQKGSVYSLNHDTFHKVESYFCITFLSRGSYQKEHAEVVRPVHGLKVCPFSQKVEESSLWEIVDKMLKQ